MLLPVQITFRNMEPDAKLEREVQAQTAKLERYCDHITSCRVLLEPIGGRYRGNLCHVRIDLGLRKHQLVVEHEPTLYANALDEAREEVTKDLELGGEHKRPHRAIRDAFAEMRRRLQDCVRERRGSVKTHNDDRQTARVTELDPERSCGFCEADETGERIYFHRNSVVDEGFAQLRIGSQVRVLTAPGEKGRQATTVQIMGPKSNRKKAEGVVLVPPRKKRGPASTPARQ